VNNLHPVIAGMTHNPKLHGTVPNITNKRAEQEILAQGQNDIVGFCPTATNSQLMVMFNYSIRFINREKVAPFKEWFNGL
jgi:hypothetical protein